MYLQKTEKARAELASRSRLLGIRERAFLLMADGRQTRSRMLDLVPAAEAMVDALIAQGYLLPVPAEAQGHAPAPPYAAAPIEVAQARPTTVAAPAADASAAHAADAFDGKRSLATTRMFLFDLCERMFARRAPDQAEAYREALRGARDRDTMLEVARAMVAEIEAHAGTDRADGISARIAMLLPAE
ncbi:hypothetical protein ACFX58_06980 [Sphingomonas sp. NCPPB 2930]